MFARTANFVASAPEIYPNPFQGLKRHIEQRQGEGREPEIYPNPFQGLKLCAASDAVRTACTPRNLPESLSGIETEIKVVAIDSLVVTTPEIYPNPFQGLKHN